VKVSVLLENLDEIESHNQTLELRFCLLLSWKDHRGQGRDDVDAEKIWRPHVKFSTSLKLKVESTLLETVAHWTNLCL